MSENSRMIDVQVRLRPLRLAFLIDPSNANALRRAIELNTCVWGGYFNSFVPVFQEVPQEWRSDRGDSEPKEIARGYLDAFEPDYLVFDGHEKIDIGFDSKRILRSEEILSDAAGRVRYGVDVNEIYRFMYEKEYQFVRRHPAKFAIPVVQDAELSLFSAACFGAFPVEGMFSYFERNYRDVFDASEFAVHGGTLLEFFERLSTPISIGAGNVVEYGRTLQADPVLFLLDGENTSDLIDFWNLRALGRRVLPVPTQWMGQFAESLREMLVLDHAPYRIREYLASRLKILRARSVGREEMREFSDRIHALAKGRIVVQEWYPRIWNARAREADYAERCNIREEDARFDCVVQQNIISFGSLAPKFADNTSGEVRWVNVVELEELSAESELAKVLPLGIDTQKLLWTWGIRSAAVNSEGIVLDCFYRGQRHSLRLPDGLAVFQAWFESRGYLMQLSGPVGLRCS